MAKKAAGSPAVTVAASAAVGASPVKAGAAVVEVEKLKVKPWQWKEITNPNNKDGWVQCEEYVEALEFSVRNRLLQVLTDGDLGLKIEGTLEQQNPVKISGGEQKNLKSFKEHWRWDNCRKSLESNGIYEAPGNGFWASAKKAKWLGKEIIGAEMTYGHLAAGREHWSEEKFIRSSEDPSKRVYYIAGVMPTAVAGLAEVPDEDGKGFLQLPCFGTRAVLAGWYSQMDDALRALESAVGDQKPKAAEHVLKLYESFLSFPMRLRLAPSHSQVCLDRITYGEDLHNANHAASDSFFDFAQNLIALHGTDPQSFALLQRKAVQTFCDNNQIKFHGHNIGTNGVRALLNVAPYAGDGRVNNALKSIEDVTKKLNDQTNISLLMAATTKHYPNATEAAVGAFKEFVVCLRASLLFKDIIKDSHLNKDFLVGTRSKVVWFFEFVCGRASGRGFDELWTLAQI